MASSSSSAVGSLPIEDGCWTLHVKEETDGGLVEIKLRLCDSSNAELEKCTLLVNSEVPMDRLASSLCSFIEQTCASLPVPRRPRAVIWNDCYILEKHNILLPIPCYDHRQRLPCSCVFQTLQPINIRTCAQCGFSGSRELFRTCGHCLSIYYCSSKCLHLNSVSHSAYCFTFMAANAYRADLFNFPFRFAYTNGQSEGSRMISTLADDFDELRLLKWLEDIGVKNHGLWLRETPNCLNCTKDIPPYGELNALLDPYVLPLEGITMESDVAPPDNTLKDWRDYYKWRELPLHSPIAVLLSPVLTVYHVIQNSGARSCASLTILLAGIEKEADYVITFKELALLIPNVKIRLFLIGPMISHKVSGKLHQVGNITIQLYAGHLHEFLTLSINQKIDLIICLNAGISAYHSWKDSILMLRLQHIETYITDYCVVSLTMSKQVIESLNKPELANELVRSMQSLGLSGDTKRSVSQESNLSLTEPIVNPFRGPVRKYNESTNLPWLSNAFISKLVYL